MSEPSVGTDVMGMSTTAVESDDGSYFTLNGSKMWITNGTIDGITTGDIFLVYAKTSSPNRPDAPRGNNLTSFLVEKGTPGFTLGQKIEDKCGMRASMTAELVFSDVKVPRSNVVGQVGGATLCMMRNLEIERITLAAMSLGIARRSIEVMSSYSQERRAFGKPIGEFGQVWSKKGNRFNFTPIIQYLYLRRISKQIYFAAISRTYMIRFLLPF
jgi:isovaleryl-CoA dehydrogenase